MKRRLSFVWFLAGLFTAVMASPAQEAGKKADRTDGVTFHLGFESEKDILSDFLSAAKIYRVSSPGEIPVNPLVKREMAIVKGKFGNCLHIPKGWSVTKGTANESGADLDLIVATMWGDYRNKPHYWGAGKFYGDRGTLAFWIKAEKLIPDALYPVFLQSAIAWGRNERDLLRIDVDKDRRVTASIRDIYYQYHRVQSSEPAWAAGEWQHFAVVYDRSQGLKLYRNGKLIASNWGSDAWLQTPLPGLFSPFYPESFFDELYYFNRPLSDLEISSLYQSNVVSAAREESAQIDDPARGRLLAGLGDLEKLELPELVAGRDSLGLKQVEAADCHDEKVPSWWVMDGRYELAWPHPYMNFTFILGDVDFHGEKVDIDLKQGQSADYMQLEGILDGAEAFQGTPGRFEDKNKILDLNGYRGLFYSQKVILGDSAALRFPFTKKYGTPEGLVDTGSLKMPLSGKTRIHEVMLWDVDVRKAAEPAEAADIVWNLGLKETASALDIRYLDALYKLKNTQDRALFTGSRRPISSASSMALQPLQSLHFIGPDSNPDLAVDKVALSFFLLPQAASDVLWIEFRDPANPSRLWAKSVVRLMFEKPGQPQKVDLEFDIVDLMLAAEDRLWVELKFAGRETVLSDAHSPAKLALFLSRDRKKSLDNYARHELMPTRIQYMKEYNYQPWLFTGEKRSSDSYLYFGGSIPITLSFITSRQMSLDFWTNFGGPYDMWYPPEAVLRHDLQNPVASYYRLLTGERGFIYGGAPDREFKRIKTFALEKPAPVEAPSWAVWERELYAKLLRTVHKICDQQRKDGFFWGGFKDDAFIPLGYAGIPFMGDSVSRKTFLRLYDGIEEVGAFKNGYCDIWPSDYLHITDIIVSRGLMVPYALGSPHVLEREMITAKVYRDLMEKNNAERAKKGLPPFELKPESAQKEPKLWGEKIIEDYETTQVLWYWGKSTAPATHDISDRAEITRELMTIALRYDDVEEFSWSESLHHTDKYGGVPGRQELIRAALGGKLQGRIEPHPHSIVVSFDNPDSDIARLAGYADEKTTRLNLYNFKESSQTLGMRLYRLKKGSYRFRAAADANDNGLIDADEALLRDEKVKLSRFSTLACEIPPRRNLVVEISLEKELRRDARLPDVALDPDRDLTEREGRLEVKVHNIGDGTAREVTVEALDEKGNVIASQTIPEIAAPLDFIPKVAEARLDLQGKTWKRVVIDRRNSIEEILEENNEAVAR